MARIVDSTASKARTAGLKISAKPRSSAARPPSPPDFAAVAETAKYHVFLTGYDGQSDLSACDRTPSGFRERAKNATAGGCFSWRVVAKRKDIAAAQFETVAVPPPLVMPSLPEPGAPPAPPDRRPGI